MRVRPRAWTALTVCLATGHHLARLSFWWLNRDRACTGTTGWVDGTCGSVSRQPYDFARIIARFTG
jgi:chitinase